MKKILIALAITGLGCLSAQAQTECKKNCEVVQNKVCRKGGDCYKTQYAENFKVCKNNNGYFICCETANYTNSTHPAFIVMANDQEQEPNYYAQNERTDAAYDEHIAVDGKVPESQSYAGYNVISSGTSSGYYLQKGKMRTCYVGDNVAEENRAPYQGCPSPQYDGPDKNIARNLNVVTQ